MDGDKVCMDRTGRLYMTNSPERDDVILEFPSIDLQTVLGASTERLDKDVAEDLIGKLKSAALKGSVILLLLGSFFLTAPTAKAIEADCFIQPSGAITTPCPADSSNTPQVTLVPSTTTGLSLASALVPNNATVVIIKAGPGKLYHLHFDNNSAVIAYVNFFNISTGGTCGTTASVDRFEIPTAATFGGSIDISWEQGVSYSVGIAYCVHTVYGDADATAPAANAYILNAYFK